VEGGLRILEVEEGGWRKRSGVERVEGLESLSRLLSLSRTEWLRKMPGVCAAGPGQTYVCGATGRT
jgi:hypothetical protein